MTQLELLTIASLLLFANCVVYANGKKLSDWIKAVNPVSQTFPKIPALVTVERWDLLGQLGPILAFGYAIAWAFRVDRVADPSHWVGILAIIFAWIGGEVAVSLLGEVIVRDAQREVVVNPHFGALSRYKFQAAAVVWIPLTFHGASYLGWY